MQFFQLALLAAAAPLILSASTVDFTNSNDTVSFNNNNPGTLTLGANNCIGGKDPTCTLTGDVFLGGSIYTFTLTMPDDSKSPFSYKGDGAITTTGSPTLDFTLTDNRGDAATGTYTLTSLSSDGGAGVDLDGTISIKSVTSGFAISTFDSVFGLTSSKSLSFALDVGDCTSGGKSKSCIAAGDPTAKFLSFDLTPNAVVSSTVPEPGTFGLLGLVSGGFLIAVRRRRSQKS
jgi:hypothetical protein